MSKEEKKEYLGWDGVKKLAKELGYSWFDVCDIIWKTKYHKHPKLKEILLFSVIKKNLINIESNKQVFDLNGNPVFRKQGEQDIHYAIRTDLDLFKENYKDPDEFCCLFVIDEDFHRFVYIPYPND